MFKNPDDEEVRRIIEEHGLDKSAAERAQELIDEGLDEAYAVELAEEGL